MFFFFKNKEKDNSSVIVDFRSHKLTITDDDIKNV